MVTTVRFLYNPVRDEELRVGEFLDLQIKKLKFLLLFLGILSIVFFLTSSFVLFVLSYATSIPLTSV